MTDDAALEDNATQHVFDISTNILFFGEKGDATMSHVLLSTSIAIPNTLSLCLAFALISRGAIILFEHWLPSSCKLTN